MTMLRIFFTIALPASIVAFFYFVGAMTIEAAETLNVRNLLSTDLLREYPLEHLAIPTLAIFIAICVGWFRLFESQLSGFENLIFSIGFDLAALGTFLYGFALMFTFIALPLLMLGTLTGLIIIASFIIAGATVAFLVG